MIRAKDETSAADFLPERKSLRALREAAALCRGCPLYRRATQTVFGAGPARAEIMLIGEVPGDQEDRQGKPFVGPAGRLLDEALAAAGTDRKKVYLTNVVKHFKWEQVGKRRRHKKPNAWEIDACRPWWEAEIETVGPHTIVVLGATAAQSLLGRGFRLTEDRGKPIRSEWCERLFATYHPSAVLRAPDEVRRHELRGLFFADIRTAVNQR
jgi:DNA polymerase